MESRFVYGRAEDFKLKSTSYTVEVYKFAHEMQIDSLTKQLTELFKEPTAVNVFAIFELFCKSENKPGLEICKKVGDLRLFVFLMRYLAIITGFAVTNRHSATL